MFKKKICCCYKIYRKIADVHIVKEHYQSILRKKNAKSVKYLIVITY